MPVTLRVLLIVGALLTFLYFVYQVRKKRLQIDDSLFWIIFSFFLLIIAVFPAIISFVATILNFESPANLVYLLIIFILLMRLFAITLKLSKARQQIGDLTQRLALLEHRTEDNCSDHCSEHSSSHHLSDDSKGSPDNNSGLS